MTVPSTLPQGVAARRRRTRVLVIGLPLRRRRIAIALNVLALAVIAVALAVASDDQRALAAPMLLLGELALFYVTVLWKRDGRPPVFEAGTLAVLATAVYGMIPLAGFLMMHGDWERYSDLRLQQYAFDPFVLGRFGWGYVIYAAAFVATYLVVRGRAAVKTTAFDVPRPQLIEAIVIVFGAVYAFVVAVAAVYDLRMDISYTPEELQTRMEMLSRMPYIVRQVSENVTLMLLLLKQAVVILLLSQWRKRWCRAVLIVWLAYEVSTVVFHLGARTTVVLILMSAGLLYHRLVRPVRFRTFVLVGALLLAMFLVAGALRNLGHEAEQPKNVLTTANEFQALYATAFDLQEKKNNGSLPPVPWQIYAADFYLEIPSQLLPFEKIDPANWYIQIIGQAGYSTGFMFGVMSQAAVGLGWPELALRGFVLALFLALLHRWYVRRATHFWPTLFYLFVAVWIYSTMRASTFWFVYYIVYRFLPVLLATKFVEMVLSRVRRRRA
ncbi:MAG TPA: hypothetical protein VI670_23320 [Thermoanaerobaculia bacterium]|jgi:hypothetical protein